MKNIFILIILIIIIIFGAVFFLRGFEKDSARYRDDVSGRGGDFCTEISKYAKQGAEQIILEECKKYYNKSCLENKECGSFPCEIGKCLIRSCDSDAECPVLCGLHATPVPGFCTTIDVE